LVVAAIVLWSTWKKPFGIDKKHALDGCPVMPAIKE